MTRDDILQELQTIKDKGSKALQLLESQPLSAVSQTEIQSLVRWIKEKLQTEYDRMLPNRMQKTMTMFELGIYSLAIKDAWKNSGIRCLELDGVPDLSWQRSLEMVVCSAGKRLT